MRNKIRNSIVGAVLAMALTGTASTQIITRPRREGIRTKRGKLVDKGSRADLRLHGVRLRPNGLAGLVREIAVSHTSRRAA